MRRLIRTLVLTAAAVAFLWYSLPEILGEKSIFVETILPKKQTVYESVGCKGTLRPAGTFRLSVGVPAEITEVYVACGDPVVSGQPILRYRCLSDREITEALYTKEIADRLQMLEDSLQETEILAAAEYYAVSGELPSFFKDFYLPPDTTGEKPDATSGFLLAPVDGTVTSLQCGQGEVVSGLFTAAVIEDTTKMVAQLRAPESTLSKLAVGLPVNISCSAFGDRIFPAQVISVGTQAITTGGLFGSSETYIDVTAAINTEEILLSGLTVRGTIFFVAYDDAILIPHEAVVTDEGGKEFVFRCIDGIAYKTPIVSLYENDEGVVSGGGIGIDDILVKHPAPELTHGSPVEYIDKHAVTTP